MAYARPYARRSAQTISTMSKMTMRVPMPMYMPPGIPARGRGETSASNGCGYRCMRVGNTRRSDNERRKDTSVSDDSKDSGPE